MSKKIKAIEKMVFFSQQKPELLAELLAGMVSDVATDISIDGPVSVIIPTGDTANTAKYSASVVSQYGDPMVGEVTYSLKANVTGVSISGDTVSVAKTASAGKFTVVATSGSVKDEIEVELVAE